MNETVKSDLKISRKKALLLSHFIEKGLSVKKDDSSISGNISEDEISELKNVSQEFLQKTGFVELNQKLISFSESFKH